MSVRPCPFSLQRVEKECVGIIQSVACAISAPCARPTVAVKQVMANGVVRAAIASHLQPVKNAILISVMTVLTRAIRSVMTVPTRWPYPLTKLR